MSYYLTKRVYFVTSIKFRLVTDICTCSACPSVPVPIVSRKSEKPAPKKKEPEEKPGHPLHMLRKKYPLGLPACVDLADDAPNEMTTHSSNQASGLVSPALGRRSVPLIR